MHLALRSAGLFALSLPLLACVAAAERAPIDCTLPRADTRLDECPVVRRASEFPTCLAASDVDGHACIVMDADLAFCEDEPPIPITAFFDRSGRTLDCAGGTIDHGRGRHGAGELRGGEPTPPGAAHLPLVRFVEDRSLSDITVRDCTLRGTRHAGVQMTRFFGGQLGPDGTLDPDEPLPVGHERILFEDLVIEDVETGIYLGNFSRDVTMRRVRIDGSRRIAIYSEAGSHRLALIDSVIANNRSREALALDSTYDSEIRGTLFVNNREGAINAYRNCGELKGIVCPVVRSTPPNDNRIVDNVFVGNGVGGVRIASRQGRNHSLGWCADLGGRPGKFTDTAEGNLVADNLFVCAEGTALAVHDGPNVVRDNRILARGRCVPYEVSTGGHGRAAADALDGLVLEGNRIDADRPPLLRNVGPGVTLRD